MDTAEAMGARIPTTTFYRLLNIGEDLGYWDTESAIVKKVSNNGDALVNVYEHLIMLGQKMGLSMAFLL